MPREIAYNWLDRAELTAQEALFVSRLQANEDAAYDELVRVYSASIYHVAYRMLSNGADASDVPALLECDPPRDQLEPAELPATRPTSDRRSDRLERRAVPLRLRSSPEGGRRGRHPAAALR